MTDAALRALQDEFLQVMEDIGHFKRAGLTTPLFDKSSPTALQTQRDLWPEYAQHFKDAITRWKPNDRVIESRPPYYKHHRSDGSHQTRLDETEDQESVCPVHDSDTGGEGGSDVSAVPLTSRRLLKR